MRRTIQMKKLLLITALMMLATLASLGQTSIKVETHNVVAADEQFNLTFIIEGENSPSEFSWTPTDDFQILWGPQQGHSTSLSIVNGKRTKSVQSTYTYVLRPLRSGTFTIPAATAKVKGREISSQPVNIEVVASGTSSSSSSGAGSSSSQHPARSSSKATPSDDDLFLQVSLSRSSVVVG